MVYKRAALPASVFQLVIRATVLYKGKRERRLLKRPLMSRQDTAPELIGGLLRSAHAWFRTPLATKTKLAFGEKR